MSAKSEILAAIGKTDDVNLKAILLLLLAVLDEIGGKIDAMRADEKGLKEAVLNGHTEHHGSHHEWVSERIKANNCKEMCDWVNSLKTEWSKSLIEVEIK